ncbi:MAG: A/G-specific adenine glycosylase [Ginsengibacter sp.]
MTDRSFFTQNLLKWNKITNRRIMPWKGEKDPYKIWISEIILQQTRVEQGLKYYQRFISSFPTVSSISEAEEKHVYKKWEGLGYYMRCKNIIHTASHITRELAGRFPSTYDGLLALKGIGVYTAAAIASFAYNLPYAVIDGNVFRLLSRFFGIDVPTDSTPGKHLFGELAGKLLDKKNPGVYNQAIMDFGGTVCKPVPDCASCPLSKKCVALKKGLVQNLPVKTKNITRRKRWIYYLVIEYKKRLYIKKRTASDIWENLYEFMPIETRRQTRIPNLLKSKAFRDIFTTTGYEVQKISKVYEQQLTHQQITGQFIRIRTSDSLPLGEYALVTPKELVQLPFPKLISTYLKD